MIWPFRKCQHPAHLIGVESREKVAPSDNYPEIEQVTYSLYCSGCGHSFQIDYSRMNAEAQSAWDAEYAEWERKRSARKEADQLWENYLQARKAPR